MQLPSNEGWAVKTFKSNKSVNSYDKSLYLKKKCFILNSERRNYGYFCVKLYVIYNFDTYLGTFLLFLSILGTAQHTIPLSFVVNEILLNT